jgi:uncharacterized protein YfdQ (DUF2303 family)
MSIGEDAAEAIERLTRDAESGAVLSAPGDDVLVRVLQGDQHIETIDRERYGLSPRRPRGTALIHDPSSFAAYVTRLHTERTTMWASRDAHNPTIVAIFNDHPATDPDGPDPMGGWRDHRAALEVQRDPDWLAWLRVHGMDGEGMSPITFAEFLEDHLGNISGAAAAMEAITTFQVKRDLEFESAVNLTTGAVTVTHRETDGGQATTDVPSSLTLKLPPFIGADPVEITAKIRWRLNAGRLRWFVVLERADDREREAWEFVCGLVATGTPAGTPLVQGIAPEPVKPADAVRR